MKLLVQAFNQHSKRQCGIHFKISADNIDKAKEKVDQTLRQHHGNFLRKSGGKFTVKLKEVIGDGIHVD